MGNCKEACNEYVKSIGGVMDVAERILKEWEPYKGYGLSRKESRAAIVGFGLGLINACMSISTGNPLGDDDCELYEWLCNSVRKAREDPDEFRETMDLTFSIPSMLEFEKAFVDALTDVIERLANHDGDDRKEE